MAESQTGPVVRIKKLKSLLAMVQNAVATGDNHMFRNLYADVGGVEKDILENGALSCSAFVSFILLGLELIKLPHATVSGTQRDLIASGWQEIPAPRPGAVLIWEKKLVDGAEHRHVGFCVSGDEAISNSSAEGFPRRHSITYAGTRQIEKIYWHSDLDQG